MRLYLICAGLLFHAIPILAADGLVRVPSARPPKETIEALERIAKEKGLTVFARIDHAAAAGKIGKTLPPTELLIFGNPEGGTPLMQCAQTAGIDLPMKALAWTDADGHSWIGYNDPAWIARRHDVPQCLAAENLVRALKGLIEAAAR